MMIKEKDVMHNISTEEAFNILNMQFPVMEIFRSIQGEGIHLGRVVTFIRLAGCNLRCPWCDTKTSWKTGIKTMPVSAILEKVELGCPVVITGGEPTIHTNLQDLITMLHANGSFVSIETNGTNYVPWNVDWITCSPKPPKHAINPVVRPNELKYVVTEDFDADKAIPKEIRHCYEGFIWLQPDGTNDETMHKMWDKCLKLAEQDRRLRVGVQLHKIMEVQ